MSGKFRGNLKSCQFIDAGTSSGRFPSKNLLTLYYRLSQTPHPFLFTGRNVENDKGKIAHHIRSGLVSSVFDPNCPL